MLYIPAPHLWAQMNFCSLPYCSRLLAQIGLNSDVVGQRLKQSKNWGVGVVAARINGTIVGTAGWLLTITTGAAVVGAAVVVANTGFWPKLKRLSLLKFWLKFWLRFWLKVCCCRGKFWLKFWSKFCCGGKFCWAGNWRNCWNWPNCWNGANGANESKSLKFCATGCCWVVWQRLLTYTMRVIRCTAICWK